MPQHHRRRHSALLLAILASVSALLAATLSSPALAATQSSGRAAHHATGKAAGHQGRAFRASKALARAQKALSPATPAEERPDATQALRQLYLLQDALSSEDRAVAKRLEGRPETDQVDCSSAVACVHWQSSETTPQWAAAVRDTITYVGGTYVAAGYRSPKPDGKLGGSPATDIYIDDLPAGLYGLCNTDQPRLSGPGRYDVWSYCVVDNDYAGFPAHTPIENLQVTAAHEFFHAVQFAYDIADDGWFSESTATVMEDELYPSVNDNLQYLANSPITRPSYSMDKFDLVRGSFHYGVWNFFRYVREKYPTLKGPLPKVFLDMWKAADSSKGPRKDLYSTQAVNKALRKQHTSLDKEFALYSDATRRTHTEFAEGAALNYPTKKLAGSKALKRKGAGQAFSTRLDHLTSATFRFDNGGLASKKYKLKLIIDMADRSHGSSAVVTTYKTDGTTKTKLVKLNFHGNSARKLSFSTDKGVAAIEVTLVNASTRYANCYRSDTPFACSGDPVDQREVSKVRATVVK